MVSEKEVDGLVSKEKTIEEAYSVFLGKNKGIRDKMLMVGLLLLNTGVLIGNLVVSEFTSSEIGLRVTNFIFIILLLLLCSYIHTHNFVSWIYVGVFTYLLAV